MAVDGSAFETGKVSGQQSERTAPKELPAYHRILVTHGRRKTPLSNPSGLKGTDRRLIADVLSECPDADRYELQAIAGGRTRFPIVDDTYTCFVDPQGESFINKNGKRVIISRLGDEVRFRPKDQIVSSVQEEKEEKQTEEQTTSDPRIIKAIA